MKDQPTPCPQTQTLAQILSETNNLLADARREISASQEKLQGIKQLNSALDDLRRNPKAQS